MSSAAEGRSIRNASRIAALEAQVRQLTMRVDALEGTTPPATAGTSRPPAPAADAQTQPPRAATTAQSHPPQTTNWVDAVKRIAATPEEIEAASSPPRRTPPPTETAFDAARQTDSTGAESLAEHKSEVTATAESQAAAVVSLGDAFREKLARNDDDAGARAESFLGVKLAGIAGAAVLILAMIFFGKLAYDQGWLGRISPTFRCLAIAFAGFASLVAAEIARKRLGTRAAAALYAVGLASLYIAPYVAHAVFELINATTLFVLLTAAVAIAVGISLRAQHIAIGVLALVGGFLTPIIAQVENPSPVAGAIYFLALGATGCAMAHFVPRTFAPLRYISSLGLALIGSMLSMQAAETHLIAALAIPIGFWLILHADLVRAARQSLLAELDASAEPDAQLNAGAAEKQILDESMIAFSQGALPCGLSATATLWAVALTAGLFDHVGLATWLAPAAAIVACAGIALILIGHRSTLDEVPSSPSAALGVTHAALAIAAIIATVALALDGPIQLVAWLALAAASTVAGHITRVRSLRLTGILYLAIATLRLILIDPLFLTTHTPFTTLTGIILSPWMLLMLVTAAGWALVAAMRRRERPSKPDEIAIVATSIAAIMTAASFLHEDVALASLAVVWSLLAVAVAALAKRVSNLALIPIAAIGIAASLVTAFIAYPPLDWDASSAAIALHPALGLFGIVLIAGTAVAALAARAPDQTNRDNLIAKALVAVLPAVLFVITSLEARRAGLVLTEDPTSQRAFLSIWWGAFALATLLVGARLRLRPARLAGLGLLLLAAAKAAIYDVMTVEAHWRVVSLAILGVLLIIVALAYAKSVRRSGPAAQAPDAQPRDD